MKPATLRKHCMALAGATEQIQWGKDRVFKVAGKMFACSGTESDSRYSFKVERARFLELSDQEGIAPAPYLARASWIQIDPKHCRLSTSELKSLVSESYALVFAKLPKKTQAAIEGGTAS